MGDVNNDGLDEIIIGTMYASNIFPDTNYGGMYIYDRFGNTLTGWPMLEGYNFWSTPSLADINNDGDLEIVFSRLGFYTYLTDYEANTFPGWPKLTSWNDYHSSEIANSILENWNGSLSAADFADIDWALKKLGQSLEKIKKMDISNP